MRQNIKEALDETLGCYEDELGRRSSGLAYLQARREHLEEIINKEFEYYQVLEQRNLALLKENERLYEKVSMPLAHINFNMSDTIDIQRGFRVFTWMMETLYYREPIPEGIKSSDTDFWNKVRRKSYKSFLKLFRKKFDENFYRFKQNLK